MKNILEMLENSAAIYPDRIAFGDPKESITFSNLLNKAQKTGCYFGKKNIINPAGDNNSIVFYMEKSVQSVCAMFGAIYCNAFYSYIDIRQSADRVTHILSTIEPNVIVTDEENYEKLVEILKAEEKSQEDNQTIDKAADKSSEKSSDDYSEYTILLIDNLMSETGDFAIDKDFLDEARSCFYDRIPLYVNFTSGSTGVPKGVAVGHASVIDFITEFTKAFDITCDDVIANQAPFDFDVSVKDIYSGLYTGAQVWLIPRSYFTNPMILMDYLCEHDATILTWAVTALCFVSIMNGLSYKTPEKVRRIMFSGEVMPVKQLNKWKQYLPNAMYVNLYGPTEITCNCTYHIIDREYENDEIIPMGKAFANEKVFLLDENNEEVTEAGVEGEICVAGSCLALGYYKDFEKTSAAFVQNPLNKRFPETIYRTGDLGKYDENGLLYYCSRKDFQIKHMGQRIELGDIEVAAMAADGVTRACCLYDKKRSKIVLFFTGDATKEGVFETLKEKLPSFMLPGKATHLDEFPMNKNGKIDRNALGEML